jgi:hypothetical protein
LTLDNKRVSIGIRNRDALTSQLRKIKIMTTLTQTQPIQATQVTQPTEDKSVAKFDVALALPPAETSLDSEYFQSYIKEVARTGNTPF